MPIDLLHEEEKKAVVLLQEHSLVTTDDKGLDSMQALTQLVVLDQLTERGERAPLVAAVARALEEKLAKFDWQKTTTFFIGRRYASHARSVTENTAKWGLLPALTAQGAAHGGGEARGRVDFLGDVQSICMKAGMFFSELGGQFRQSLSVYEYALVCGVALSGHDHLNVAKTQNNSKSLDIKIKVAGQASVHGHQGDHVHAQALLQKALDNRMQVVGFKHPKK